MEEKIKAEFVQNGFSFEGEEEVLKKCASFCINYSLEPSDLVTSWELYYLNLQLDGCKVQSSQMDGFLHHLQNEQKEVLKNEEPDFHFYSSNDVDLLLNPENDNEENVLQHTPVKQSNGFSEQNASDFLSILANKTPGKDDGHSSVKKKSKSNIFSSPSTPFLNRSSRFVVQFVLNRDVLDSIEKERGEAGSEDELLRKVPSINRCSLEVLGKPPPTGFRYMNASIEDKFLSLEKRIKNFALALAANESCSVTHHVALASQESILVVGLICCDGEGRLNDQSVLLEGSAEFSGGHRVRLDLQKLLKYSVFPGQVIGVEGHNLSGHCLVASRVIDSYPISVPSQMDDQHVPLAKRITIDPKSQINASKTPRGNISMLIAAGPFTTTDNLAFQPLEELLSYSRKKNFNILILMGPFVDSQHPQIKEGTIDKLFQDVFLEQVCIRLRDYCDDMGPNARVILVPSTRDAHHDFVFPQPAFEHHYFDGMSPQITCVANPGLLRINEIMVGVCTIDVLRHLSSEEISRNSGGKTNDRLSRLAGHILNQRSFYPLYPAASGVPLDLCASPEALDILVAPDVLILPSDLAPFAKVLQLGEDLKTNEKKCVSINPGRLAKGASGGTFAEILIQEREQSYNQNENLTSLDEKTAVSIVRL